MRTTLLAAALALAAASSAHADTQLPADGSWSDFYVDNYNTSFGYRWLDGDTFTPVSFAVTIADGKAGTLTVVDRGFSGERFDVYDNGNLLGRTGSAVQGDVNGAVTFDADAALADPAFSRGSFTLSAGSHLITGVALDSATETTIGGIKLTVSPVPEPATAATLLIGLGLLIGTVRRRNA